MRPTLAGSHSCSSGNKQSRVLGQDEPEVYLAYLQVFLERYPYSFVHWTKYLALKTEDLAKAYVYALEHIPKCTELWELYLSLLKDQGNPTVYKKQMQRAIQQIGADLKSGWLFMDYYHFIQDDGNKWEFFKRLFTRTLTDMEKFVQLFHGWIDSVAADRLQTIFVKETRGVQLPANITQLQHLKSDMERQYKKALEWRQNRVQLQNKIHHYYFNGQSAERQAEFELWKQYIMLLRKQGIVQNISYCYERALMAQTQHLPLWQELFHYLENQTGKYLRVLELLRNNGIFFMNFSLDLYYYWCDLVERENVKNARNMYIKLQEIHKSESNQNPHHLQTYLRHIQLQIREKQWQNAKNIYDLLLVQYRDDLELLSFIVIEYANFIVKRFKNNEYAKNILKTYFEALPYNEPLYVNYLKFIKNFQNNDGYYDELMGIVANGLSKARKVHSGKDYQRVVILTKNQLRSTLTSIYLIKMSEKRLIEIEQKLRQEQIESVSL